MSILPQPHSHLSFSSTLISPSHHRLFLHARTSVLPLPLPLRLAPIRMGGGPRTYPGGVSKWQWKRMQAKKAKQLLKARLTRERQIYEMRKRAELSAAVSELERPWEAVERAPTLFSVGADEQLKVLADRFQKPGGFDLWTERDGPELFKAVDELPSARFFPKGVVHSVKPYGKVAGLEGSVESLSSGGESESELDQEVDEYEKDKTISSLRSRGGEPGHRRISSQRSRGGPGGKSSSSLGAGNAGVVGKQNDGYRGNPRNSSRTASLKPYPSGDSQLDDPVDGSASGSEKDVGLGLRRIGNGRNMNSSGRTRGKDVFDSENSLGSSSQGMKNGGKSNGRMANNRNSRKSGPLGTGGLSSSARASFDRKQRGEVFGGGFRSGRIDRMKGPRDSDVEVYDMSLGEDGSYGL